MGLTDHPVRATIGVADIASVAGFYENTLGLSPLEGGPDAVRIYPCGGGSQLQVYQSEHAGPSGATIATWSVSGYDAVIDELRGKGVTFETYEGMDADERGVHAFGEHRVAWLKDPEGNVISIDNGGEPS